MDYGGRHVAHRILEPELAAGRTRSALTRRAPPVRAVRTVARVARSSEPLTAQAVRLFWRRQIRTRVVRTPGRSAAVSSAALPHAPNELRLKLQRSLVPAPDMRILRRDSKGALR